MPVYPLINSFNAGEMSPYLIGRVDLDKYGTGCQRMENFRALPYGGAVFRPGTEFIHQLIGGYRLKEFIYSTETSYILAFGEEIIKIYNDGAYLASSDVVTPYSGDDVFQLQFLQINDVMYITHPDYPVQKLSRVSSSVFTLAEVEFNVPPLLDVNTDSAFTLEADGTSGSVEITAVGHTPFNADHVGSYWQLSHFREAGSVSKFIDSDGASSSIAMRGGWTIRTYGEWDASVLVERSPDDATWEVIANFPPGSQIEYTATQEETAYLRIRVADYISNTDGNAVLTTSTNYVDGLVKMTAFTDSTHMDATVINVLASTDATSRWSEGSWSEFRGFPKCIGIFEERIYYANTYYEPQRIWGSRVGDYEDFVFSVDDDASVTYAIADVQQNPIQWLMGERSLLFATTAAQWTLSGGESGEPVTPSNVKVQRQPSNLGAESFQPVSLPGITLFLQRGGRKFRELFYQFVESSYSAQDVTLLAEHITKGGIVQFAATNHPDSIAYCVRADGELAVMVYERGQANGGNGNLVAWSRYVTDGEFKSVAIIPGDVEDEVWVAVSREQEGGASFTSIERFRPRLSFLDSRPDWYFLDCGRTVDVSRTAFITEITRLQYGAVVVIDGVPHERVQYRVNSTAHGFAQGEYVRIEDSGFDELNGNVYKVCRASSGIYYLGEREDVIPSVAITNIQQDAFPLVTTATAHQITLYGMVFVRSVGGMTNVNLNAYGAQFASATTFNMNVDTTAFPAYTSGGFVDVLASTLQPVGWTVTEAGGQAVRVTNEFETASPLGGREQTLVVDGSPIEEPVVATDFNIPTLTGTGTSDNYGSILHTGLSYEGTLQINPVEVAMQAGASVSMKKRIARVTLRVNNSVGARVGPDAEHLETIPFRSTSDLTDAAVPGFSGLIEIAPNFDVVTEANLMVRQSEPLNLELLSLAIKAEIFS